MNPISVGAWLANNKGKLGIALVVLLLTVYIGTLHYSIYSKGKQIKELDAKVVELKADLLTEKGKVKVLETKLSAMVVAGQKAIENAQVWKQLYEGASKKYDKNIAAITQWKKKDNETDCQATSRLLHDYSANRVPLIQ